MNAPAPLQPIPPKRILYAEDDLVAAHAVRLGLSVDGHTVDVAADGPQAVAMFETGAYDLVLTDFKLPGMDGLELAEVIKQRAPSRPVILITACAEEVQGPVSNVDALIRKPVSVAKLHEAFRKVFKTPFRSSVVAQPGRRSAASWPQGPERA
jgi:CheY-like chemotaxis protein